MICIIKFLNESPTIFDTLADNGIPQPIDALLVNQVLSSNTPVFNIETDKAGGVVERKAGEFGLSFSLLQTNTSFYGATINEFFRGGTRGYKYLIAIQEGATVFHGTFENSDLDCDLTFKEGRYDITLLAKDTVEEWAKYLNTLNSKFNISTSNDMTFENYIDNYHLSGFNVNFDSTLTNKVGVTTYFSGSAYANGVANGTNLRNVSRLNSFNEMARGLGFTYYLSLNKTLQQLYNGGPSNWYPRSFMDININWFRNGTFVLQSDMLIDRTMVHKETITPKAKPYFFIGYRHIISTAFPELDSPDFTAVRGILTDGTNYYASDSADNFNPIYAQYPFFLVTGDTSFYFETPFTIVDIPPNSIAYVESRSDYSVFPKDFVNELELVLHNYTQLNGSTTAGSCAYARLFTTTSGFAPIQNFVINQYKRYVLGAGKKVKEVRIPINADTELNVYKSVKLTDDQGESPYYISKIKDLDLVKRSVGLELTQI